MTKQMNIEFTDDQAAIIDRLTDELNLSVGQVVAKAFALFNLAAEETRKGYHMAIVDENYENFRLIDGIRN